MRLATLASRAQRNSSCVCTHAVSDSRMPVLVEAPFMPPTRDGFRCPSARASSRSHSAWDSCPGAFPSSIS
jgi:hypothetical protein|eukprot:SAG25_NODE_376_length_8856_cov_9.128354_12_plen_71_part_00